MTEAVLLSDFFTAKGYRKILLRKKPVNNSDFAPLTVASVGEAGRVSYLISDQFYVGREDLWQNLGANGQSLLGVYLWNGNASRPDVIFSGVSEPIMLGIQELFSLPGGTGFSEIMSLSAQGGGPIVISGADFGGTSQGGGHQSISSSSSSDVLSFITIPSVSSGPLDAGSLGDILWRVTHEVTHRAFGSHVWTSQRLETCGNTPNI